jgi:hypothetical protein
MKRLIDGKCYDTEKAQNKAEFILPPGGIGDTEWADRWLIETLYRTPKGNYFIHGRGGVSTRWATIELLEGDPVSCDGEGISVVTPMGALKWLEKSSQCVPDDCPEIAALVEDA